MNNRRFFFGVLIGTAVFVYLVSSFLIASFNITLWEDGHRFFAVVAYIFLVLNLLDRAPATKVNKIKKEDEIVQKDSNVREKKESEIEQTQVS